MKTKTLYTCEVCHTDYADKDKAKRCERSHIKPKEITDKMKYHAVYNGRDPLFGGKETNYPDWIDITFENGETVRYKH